jgi:hypothetical protein
MILISHRGNINGRFEDWENKPEYINDALSLGYDVEIDLWVVNDILYLGHDEPQYEITWEYFKDKVDKLWIHCKNIEALYFVRETELHYFWHEEDTVTLTSKNYIWAYPGKQPIKGSIAVMPERDNDNVLLCDGICSDYIQYYK